MLLKGKYCKCNKRHTVHSYITSAQTSLGLFVYKKKKIYAWFIVLGSLMPNSDPCQDLIDCSINISKAKNKE